MGLEPEFNFFAFPLRFLFSALVGTVGLAIVDALVNWRSPLVTQLLARFVFQLTLLLLLVGFNQVEVDCELLDAWFVEWIPTVGFVQVLLNVKHV